MRRAESEQIISQFTKQVDNYVTEAKKSLEGVDSLEKRTETLKDRSEDVNELFNMLKNEDDGTLPSNGTEFLFTKGIQDPMEKYDYQKRALKFASRALNVEKESDAVVEEKNNIKKGVASFKNDTKKTIEKQLSSLEQSVKEKEKASKKRGRKRANILLPFIFIYLALGIGCFVCFFFFNFYKDITEIACYGSCGLLALFALIMLFMYLPYTARSPKKIMSECVGIAAKAYDTIDEEVINVAQQRHMAIIEMIESFEQSINKTNKEIKLFIRNRIMSYMSISDITRIDRIYAEMDSGSSTTYTDAFKIVGEKMDKEIHEFNKLERERAKEKKLEEFQSQVIASLKVLEEGMSKLSKALEEDEKEEGQEQEEEIEQPQYTE